jgi:hypothetical protein
VLSVKGGKEVVEHDSDFPAFGDESAEGEAEKRPKPYVSALQ